MSQDRSKVVSSFTIIKGSLIDETYAAFAAWDLTQSKRDNLRHMKESNSIGASSENWLRDVAFVISRRFDPAGRDRSLVQLAQHGCDLEVFKPALLWHMTRDEFLLRDFLVSWLSPKFAEGVYLVRFDDILPYLVEVERSGMTAKPWKLRTRREVAQSLLRIAEDFGLLGSGINKQFASYHLSDAALLYLLHAMIDSLPSARHVVQAADWKMYLLDQSALERELMRLHQFRELHYQVAGSLIELELPCSTLSDYTRRLCA